jgi:GTP-binding protein Era
VRVYKSGTVAIAGRPNAGKSTLMNALVGAELSIVTPKPQTTRRRVLGIRTADDHQIVFLDTPGLIEPTYALQTAMMQAARKSMEAAEAVVWMTDISDPGSDAAGAFVPKGLTVPIVAAVNKIDKVPPAVLVPAVERLKGLGVFREVIPVSAAKGDGLDRLVQCLLEILPPGGPMYPEDSLSDEPERFFVSEIIRKQVLLRYRDEIPYACEVRIEAFEERPGRKDMIAAVIFAEQESQKGILIGRAGEALKSVGQASRLEIEAFLGRPVYLELRVKVKPKWRRTPGSLREFGYT